MLYHYTSEYIWDIIEQDGYIKTSWPKLKGHPKGVYLTDLDPSTDNETLIRKLYGNGKYAYRRFVNRLEVAIIIKDRRLNYEYVRPNVYYCDDDIVLGEYMYGYIIRSDSKKFKS